jgi:hypothetical protein
VCAVAGAAAAVGELMWQKITWITMKHLYLLLQVPFLIERTMASSLRNKPLLAV